MTIADPTPNSFRNQPDERDDDENRRRAAMLRQLMVLPLAPGQNRLMISHRANIAQAFGKEWFDVKEGEASIFRIENGTYTLIARLQLDEWSRISSAFRR